MTSDSSPIRIRSRAHLLAEPCRAYGYVPHDSVVVLCTGDRVGQFLARVDLADLLLGLEGFARRCLLAAAHSGERDPQWWILAYPGAPELWTGPLQQLSASLGGACGVLVAGAGESHELLDGELVRAEPLDLAVAMAEQGIDPDDLHADRASALAAVHERAHDERRSARATAVVEDCSEDARVELLRDVLEQPLPTPDTSALLARLLCEETCLAETVRELTSHVARDRIPRLLAAHRAAAEEQRAPVLAVLALAQWLAGDGAAANESLEVLDTSTSGHPLADVVRTMLHQGVPPARWDAA